MIKVENVPEISYECYILIYSKSVKSVIKSFILVTKCIQHAKWGLRNDDISKLCYVHRKNMKNVENASEIFHGCQILIYTKSVNSAIKSFILVTKSTHHAKSTIMKNHDFFGLSYVLRKKMKNVKNASEIFYKCQIFIYTKCMNSAFKHLILVTKCTHHAKWWMMKNNDFFKLCYVQRKKMKNVKNASEIFYKYQTFIYTKSVNSAIKSFILTTKCTRHAKW